MTSHVRRSSLTQLRAAQNTDGGWGYFPGKQSWLEPTCYALLALYKDEGSRDAFDAGWRLMRSWQAPDGGWRPSAVVENSNWATALCVTLHSINGAFDEKWERGVRWLLESRGVEGGWLERLIALVYKMPVDYDRRWKGWPWIAETASWIEPTVHSLVALKKSVGKFDPGLITKRIQEAERMIADRRSVDGGWNYGNRRVLREDLPSYPETTGLALLGLQGSKAIEIGPAIELAQRQWERTDSRLARAWLAIALRNYGRQLPETPESEGASDLMVTALEAIATPGGGHQWLKPA